MYDFGHNHSAWQLWKGCSDSPTYCIQCTIHSDCDYIVENIRCWYFIEICNSNCKANYSYVVSVDMSYNISFTAISKSNWPDVWSLKQYQLSPTWVFCRLIQEAGEICLKLRILSMGWYVGTSFILMIFFSNSWLVLFVSAWEESRSIFL